MKCRCSRLDKWVHFTVAFLPPTLVVINGGKTCNNDGPLQWAPNIHFDNDLCLRNELYDFEMYGPPKKILFI